MNNCFNNTIGIKGEYNIRVRNAEGVCTQETGFRKNMILDRFFTLVNTSSLSTNIYVHGRLRVGTGTTPPVATQTTLEARVADSAYSSEITRTFTVANGMWELVETRTFFFTLGAVVGNISELGLAFDPTPNPQVDTRALITDVNGNPTTVTVTASEQLEVVYRFSVVGSDADVTGTINLAGTTHNWVSRRSMGLSQSYTTLNNMMRGNRLSPSAVYAAGTSLGDAGQPVSGSWDWGGTDTKLTSPVGVLLIKRDYNTTQGNVAGGISVITDNSSGDYKISFDPPIPKDSTKTLSLTYSQTWTRA